MTEIDTLMARLHAAAAPPALDLLDGAALAAAARTRGAQTRNGGAIAAVGALLLGIAGSALPAGPVAASPLLSAAALAPSALLAD